MDNSWISAEDFFKQVTLGSKVSQVLNDEIQDKALFLSVIATCIDLWADKNDLNRLDLIKELHELMEEVKH